MTRYKGKYLGTISNELLSNNKLLAFRIQTVLGRILPDDYGKQVFDNDGTIQVENDEQRTARLNGVSNLDSNKDGKQCE